MSKIKSCFISRWEEGFLVEVDFSQLEVIALAELSQDEQLLADLRSGIDMHTVRAADLYGIQQHEVSKAQRQLAKQLSFQLQYGAGAKSMAETNGISVTMAKRFIFQYYDRYPRVACWQQEIANEVKKSRTVDGFTAKGYPKGVGMHKSPTGRMYVFDEYDGFNDGDVSFSPTQMKNFPVQGFATGDIVPLVLGKIVKRIKNDKRLTDKFLMINTIHDSVLFDTSDFQTMEIGTDIVIEVMENAPKYMKEIFGIEISLPLKVEAKYGKNWMDMEKYVDRVPF